MEVYPRMSQLQTFAHDALVLISLLRSATKIFLKFQPYLQTSRCAVVNRKVSQMVVYVNWSAKEHGTPCTWLFVVLVVSVLC
jgi:hypothetical protein